MHHTRFAAAALSLMILIGAGCRPAAPASAPVPDDEARIRRETPAATSSPEAPPANAPAVVTALPPAVDWPTWRGAWFDIKYPPGFAARAGRAYCIEGAGCDSAFFTSPDGAVEFYVFSPLWSGDPSPDLALDPKTERLVEKKEQLAGAIMTRWATIAARDGSYTRSTVDITDDNFGSPVRHAFGIRYRDAAAYAGWREAYLAFKASLIQYAD